MKYLTCDSGFKEPPDTLEPPDYGDGVIHAHFI